MKLILKISFLLVLGMTQVTTLSAQDRRALWVWSSSSVVGSTSNENILINECLASDVTDLYLYSPSILGSPGAEASTRAFITKATCNNIRVWGMDGWRGYFSDLCGPGEFYNNIQEVIDYNASSLTEEQFFGFHGDNEFHVSEGSSGCGPANVFHYGSTDAALSTTPGSGLWQDTEKADRDSLMTDFVRQTDDATAMCHNAGLEYSISVMPWVSAVNWTHNAIGYQSTPLMATYKGVTKEVYKHLMDYLDEYVIMSYHTNVAGKVVDMCEDELAYADGLAAGDRPRIFSGLETHCGVGQYVSFCDTPGEDSKNHVKNEMDAHQSMMESHVSYTGQAIHDWVGWSGLSPASNNSSEPPGCPVTSITEDKSDLWQLLVSPNPATGIVYITLSGDLINRIIITDITGNMYQEISTKKQTSVMLDITGLTKGLYLVKAVGEQSEYVTKLIKH